LRLFLHFLYRFRIRISLRCIFLYFLPFPLFQ
jgi:hypothetical protein